MHDPSLHLFIDDYHIRNAYCLKRVFYPLECNHRPVLLDSPGRYVAWACVRWEEEKFRCWYASGVRLVANELAKAGVWGTGEDLGYYPDRHPEAIPVYQLSACGYAESGDGLKWTRPNLGLINWRGSTENNLCFDGSGPMEQFGGFVTGLDSVSVLRDDDETDRAKRYKMINHWESIHCWDGQFLPELKRPKELLDKFWSHRAKYLTTSPDGIHWDKNITRIKEVEGGDYCGVTRDERNKQWMFADRPAIALGTGYCRLAGLSVSKDLYHWPAHLQEVMFPGEYEEYGHRFEHHGWTPFNYGDQDLAVLELSVIGAPVMGILCSHRDGQRWQILNYHTPIVQIGPKGADDDTIVAVTRNAPFAVGEKLRFYYNGRHGWGSEIKNRVGGLFIGEMRLDGFAGMTVDTVASQRYKTPAVMQTQTLRVTQKQLQINICGHRQSAGVAILDDSMTPIPGYDVTDCLPIEEDGARAVVRWKDHADLSALKGQDVHLNIRFNAGTLYSVRI